MWRFDATPRRVAAPSGDAPGPLGAAAVAPRKRRAATRVPRPPTAPTGRERRLEIVVASGIDAPATARAAVVAWLSPQITERVIEDVQLLVSELVTNSVRHARLAAGAAIAVSVEVFDAFVRVEVEDPGDVAIGTVAPDREHGGGFGLYLVENLAQRWGSRHEGTTRVWADLAIAPAA
jgi:anti-sigma regulatory factor (Ser/Thr protein kinase)